MAGIGKNTGQNLRMTKAEDFSMLPSSNAPLGTVYGELKLSEKLSNELNKVRNMVDALNEDLEEVTYLKDQLEKENSEMKTKLKKKTEECQHVILKMTHMTQNCHNNDVKHENMLSMTKSLIKFVQISEVYRKKFSEELREALSVNDESRNKIFELSQNKKLNEISFHLLQDKLNMLFESINAISNAKNLEDKFMFKVEE